jgi:hypothetical protein
MIICLETRRGSTFKIEARQKKIEARKRQGSNYETEARQGTKHAEAEARLMQLKLCLKARHSDSRHHHCFLVTSMYPATYGSALGVVDFIKENTAIHERRTNSISQECV